MQRYAGPVAVVALTLGFPLGVAWWAADGHTALRWLILALALAVGMAVRDCARLPSGVVWAVGVFVIVFVMASLASATPLLSLLGRSPRFEGVVWLLAVLATAALGAKVLHSDLGRSVFHRSASAMLVVLAVASLADVLSSAQRRIVTFTGNASDAAALAVFGVASTLWGRADAWGRAGLGAALLTVGLAGSRAGLLATGVLVAVKAGQAWWKDRRWGSLWPLAWGASSLVVMLVTPLARGRILLQSPLAGATVDGRRLMWRESLDLWLAQPLLGAGPSRFVDEINAHHTLEWARIVGPANPPDSPHNALLQVLTTTGILGLLAGFAVIATIVLAWRGTNHKLRAPAAAAALGVGLVALTHVTSPVYVIPLALLVGGSLGRGSGGDAPNAVALAARFGTGVLAIILAVWGGAVLAAESKLAAGAEALAAGRLDAIQTLVEVGRWPLGPDLARRAGHALVQVGWSHPTHVESTALLEPACAALPSSVECLIPLADAYAQAQDSVAERRVLDTVAGIDATNADVVLRLGSAAAEAGDFTAAEGYFLEVASLSPQAPGPWENLERLYRTLGNEEAAAEARAEAQARR